MRTASKLANTAIAATIMLQSIAPVILANGPDYIFTDVPSTYIYANEIKYAADHGIVSGYNDGSFHPNEKITRGAFAKLTINTKHGIQVVADWETCDPDVAATLQKFPDVKKTDVFFKYICIAESESILKGFKDGEFKPGEPVTFAAAAKIAVRALDPNHGIDVNADLGQYINYLASKDAIPPTLSATDGGKQITRGETAFLMQMIKDNYVKLPAEPAPLATEYIMRADSVITTDADQGSLVLDVVNHGIHCTTTQNTFIEINVKQGANIQKIHLERSCTGLGENPGGGMLVEGEETQDATAFGYKFRLVRVVEREAYQVETFEYYVKVYAL